MVVGNVLFFGMAGVFSHGALRALLEQGVNVCALIIPAQGPPPLPPIMRRPAPRLPPIPLITQAGSPSAEQLAWHSGIPVYALRAPDDPAALAMLTQLQPDLACVACFDQRIPPALLALPRLGFINLHPALLPAHRGPAPLFWIFHEGRGEFGVSVHRLDTSFDTGDLLLQAPLTLPDGISGIDAERTCAGFGGQLMAEAVRGLCAGTLQAQPQKPGGSYQSLPAAPDFAIDPRWPARRAYNFMRGTADWGYPYLLTVAGQHFALAEAISYQDTTALQTAYERDGDSLLLRCNPGLLRARLRIV